MHCCHSVVQDMPLRFTVMPSRVLGGGGQSLPEVLLGFDPVAERQLRQPELGRRARRAHELVRLLEQGERALVMPLAAELVRLANELLRFRGVRPESRGGARHHE
jgi:hypothetical protein